MLCSVLQSHLALLKGAGLCFLEALVACRDIHWLYLLGHLVGMHTLVAKCLQTWKGVCYVHAMWACTDPIFTISTLWLVIHQRSSAPSRSSVSC